jgi:mRNA-degrading endonuclease RelE of RelBE toxin-antitoxin system
VPEPYSIRLTELAEAHLNSLAAYARRMIVDNLEIHLSHEPTRQSRRLKPMRPNPVAARELRLGDYRVLYDVDGRERIVTVQVVGEKIGNRLFVRGEEYTAHESHRPERGESSS